MLPFNLKSGTRLIVIAFFFTLEWRLPSRITLHANRQFPRRQNAPKFRQTGSKGARSARYAQERRIDGECTIPTNGETYRLRIARGLSQAGLASAANVSVRKIIDIEAGRGAEPGTLRAVGVALGLSKAKAIQHLQYRAGHEPKADLQAVGKLEVWLYGDSLTADEIQEFVSTVFRKLPRGARCVYEDECAGSIILRFRVNALAAKSFIVLFFEKTLQRIGIFRAAPDHHRTLSSSRLYQ